MNKAAVVMKAKIQNNEIMERAMISNAEILSQICVLVGPFKVPQTFGDLHVFLEQTTMSEYRAVHEKLLNESASYRDAIENLRKVSAASTNAQHEENILPDIRYIAGQAIDMLWREIQYLRKVIVFSAAPVEQQTIRQRIRTALQNLSASF